MIDENLSGVEYLETDIADEYRIDWYTIDGVIYGMSSDGKILDSDGDPLVNDSNARWNIERDKAAQKLNKLTHKLTSNASKATSTRQNSGNHDYPNGN